MLKTIKLFAPLAALIAGSPAIAQDWTEDNNASQCFLASPKSDAGEQVGFVYVKGQADVWLLLSNPVLDRLPEGARFRLDWVHDWDEIETQDAIVIKDGTDSALMLTMPKDFLDNPGNFFATLYTSIELSSGEKGPYVMKNAETGEILVDMAIPDAISIPIALFSGCVSALG